MIRVPKKFNGQFISRHFYEYEFQHDRLSWINNGQCYDWAYFGYRLFNAELWTTEQHAWCKAGSKFYDSETVHGVNDCMQLRCNSMYDWNEQEPTQMSLKEFQDFWNTRGGGDRFHWDTLLEDRLKGVLGKHYNPTTPIFKME